MKAHTNNTDELSLGNAEADRLANEAIGSHNCPSHNKKVNTKNIGNNKNTKISKNSKNSKARKKDSAQPFARGSCPIDVPGAHQTTY